MMTADEAHEASKATPFGTDGSPERRDYNYRQEGILDEFFEYLENKYTSELSPRIASNLRFYTLRVSTGRGFSDIENHYREVAALPPYCFVTTRR